MDARDDDVMPDLVTTIETLVLPSGAEVPGAHAAWDRDRAAHEGAPLAEGSGEGRGEVPQGNCSNADSADESGRHQGGWKLFATLQAKLALAGGYALQELADGGYLITRHDWCCRVPDLRAVIAFLRQIGGAR